jgi:hypothetical protein
MIMKTRLMHLLGPIVLLAAMAIPVGGARAQSWGYDEPAFRGISVTHRTGRVGLFAGTRFGSDGRHLGRQSYPSGQYLPVEDDAEFGEIVLFDAIGRVTGNDLQTVLEIHNNYDLYPEEVAVLLFIRELTGGPWEPIAELRADQSFPWKAICQRYDVDPERLGMSANWYVRGDPQEWWREDPDLEQRVMLDILSEVYWIDDSDLRDLSREGLGYSDIVVMLELSERSGRNAEDLLRMKMDDHWRWRTVAERYGVDLGDMDYKRSLHWHNSDFRGYYPDDSLNYHPRHALRNHRSRREYHFYGRWSPDPGDGYYHFAYRVDYDFFFPWGRTLYSYWWPNDCWWDRVYWGIYWNQPVFHPIWHPQPRWSPVARYHNDWRGDPFVRYDPPRTRDDRRYAQKVIERYGDSGRITSSWSDRVRVSSAGVETITRGNRGDGSPGRVNDRGSGTRGDVGGNRGAPPPRGGSSGGVGGRSTSGGGSRDGGSPPPSRGSGDVRGSSNPPPSGGGSRGGSSGGTGGGSRKGDRGGNSRGDDGGASARSTGGGGGGSDSDGNGRARGGSGSPPPDRSGGSEARGNGGGNGGGGSGGSGSPPPRGSGGSEARGNGGGNGGGGNGGSGSPPPRRSGGSEARGSGGGNGGGGNGGSGSPPPRRSGGSEARGSSSGGGGGGSGGSQGGSRGGGSGGGGSRKGGR